MHRSVTHMGRWMGGGNVDDSGGGWVGGLLVVMWVVVGYGWVVVGLLLFSKEY